MEYLFCGGDERMVAASRCLARRGHTVTHLCPPVTDRGGKGVRYGEDEGALLRMVREEREGAYDALVLPAPLTRDGYTLVSVPPGRLRLAEVFDLPVKCVFGGGFSSEMTLSLRNAGKEVVDILSLPAYANENAALTAEAALALILTEGRRSLGDLAVGVIGYGRIGEGLTLRLLSLGARVTVYARSESARQRARTAGALAYDTADFRALGELRVLCNTVPAPLLGEHVRRLHDCILFELASGKGNIPEVQKEGVQVVSAQGLPGRILPYSAGELYARTVLSLTEHGM